MRLGIVSDIHCNIESLDRALATMEEMGGVDEVLCAGDMIFSFRFSNEVVARIREIGARVVLGNHEADLLGPLGERARHSKENDPELVRWLSQQPYRIDTEIDGKKLTMFHATPAGRFEYVYEEDEGLQEFGEIGSDIVIYGHTHMPLDRRVNGTHVINPGSAGQPRDPANGFRSSFGIFDTQSEELLLPVYDDPRHAPREPEPDS